MDYDCRVGGRFYVTVCVRVCNLLGIAYQAVCVCLHFAKGALTFQDSDEGVPPRSRPSSAMGQNLEK